MSLTEVNTTSHSLAKVPEYQAIKYSNNQNDAPPFFEDGVSSLAQQEVPKEKSHYEWAP